MTNLDGWTLCDLEDAPDEPGIYLWFGVAGVEYIGQSKNIRKRLMKHERKMYIPKNGKRIAIKIVPDIRRRLYLENYYIKKFDPIWNDERY